MRADAVLDGLSSAAQFSAAGAGIHAHAVPTRLCGLPFDLREFLLAAIRQNEAWLSPVCPVGGEAVAAVGDDEEELLGPLQRNIDVHAVVWRGAGDKLGVEQRLWSGEQQRGGEESEQKEFHAKAESTPEAARNFNPQNSAGSIIQSRAGNFARTTPHPPPDAQRGVCAAQCGRGREGSSRRAGTSSRQSRCPRMAGLGDGA